MADQFEKSVQLEKVRRAKAMLKNKLSGAVWLRGIGIGGSPDNYCVKVNVAAMTDEVRNEIPTTINGVPVIVTVVGNIKAY